MMRLSVLYTAANHTSHICLHAYDFCLHILIYIYIYFYTCTHMICILICVYIYIRTPYVCTYIHAYVYIYIHIDIRLLHISRYSHTYVHMHTHVWTPHSEFHPESEINSHLLPSMPNLYIRCVMHIKFWLARNICYRSYIQVLQHCRSVFIQVLFSNQALES